MISFFISSSQQRKKTFFLVVHCKDRMIIIFATMERIHKTTVILFFWWSCFPLYTDCNLCWFWFYKLTQLACLHSPCVGEENLQRSIFMSPYIRYTITVLILWIFQTRYEGMIRSAYSMALLFSWCSPSVSREKQGRGEIYQGREDIDIVTNYEKRNEVIIK